MTAAPGLERSVIIGTGLEPDRVRPLAGHVPPVPVGGLLRYQPTP